MLRDVQNDCSAEEATFDSWVKKYRTTGDLYSKFQPCSGHLIEEKAKKTIKFCYCYNFCGAGQVYNGCEVDGLEGRLDLGANLFSSYKAVYVRDSYSSYIILSHLIISHLISSHLISSHLISSHLISSHLISSHLISSYIQSHLISTHLSHLILSYLTLSYAFLSYLILSHLAYISYFILSHLSYLILS